MTKGSSKNKCFYFNFSTCQSLIVNLLKPCK